MQGFKCCVAHSQHYILICMCMHMTPACLATLSLFFPADAKAGPLSTWNMALSIMGWWGWEVLATVPPVSLHGIDSMVGYRWSSMVFFYLNQLAQPLPRRNLDFHL